MFHTYHSIQLHKKYACIKMVGKPLMLLAISELGYEMWRLLHSLLAAKLTRLHFPCNNQVSLCAAGSHTSKQ